MGKEDSPQMHTAEHVLNSVMDAMFHKGRCYSAHINPKKSKCDYHFDRALTDDEITTIQSRVNEVLTSNLPVTATQMPRDEAMTRFNLERLPDSAGDSLRIVHVGDVDHCPCIGHHVQNTSEIGTMNIISHDFTDGVLRLRFKLDKPA
ncbi:MAG: hypothetical protein R3Y11_02260 [Pseudomonadota bacterium]